MEVSINTLSQDWTRPKENLSWSQFDEEIVYLALKAIKSDDVPDYFISIGEDGMAVGNAHSRLFSKTVGVWLASSDGVLAENISIVNQALQGKGLLLSARAGKHLSNAKERLEHQTNKIKTSVLSNCEQTEKILPDEIYNRIHIRDLTKDDLSDLSAKEILQFASMIYEYISQDSNLHLKAEDLRNCLAQRAFKEFTVPSYEGSNCVNVTWEEYCKFTIALALKIVQSGRIFNFAVAIGRGGLAVGKGCSILLGIPLAVLNASSYAENGECKRGELNIAQNISVVNKSCLKGNGLLFDDLADSGVTLEKTKNAVKNYHPDIEEVETAVLFQKTCTTVIPDHCILTVKKGKWIYFPEEIFERIALKHLKSTDLSQISDKNLFLLAKKIIQNLPSNPNEHLSKDMVNKFVMQYL